MDQSFYQLPLFTAKRETFLRVMTETTTNENDLLRLSTHISTSLLSTNAFSMFHEAQI